MNYEDSKNILKILYGCMFFIQIQHNKLKNPLTLN